MLADLSTYSLRDFLLFDETIYRGLFGQLNAAFWPMAAVAILLAVALLVFRRRRPGVADRGVAALLATAFAISAALFFFGVYETVNFAAVYPGWGFVLEAGLLLVAVFLLPNTGGSSSAPASASPGRTGVWLAVALVVYALFGHPLAGFAAGRASADLEWFALAPAPTALAALGFLGGWRSRWRFALIVVPVVWLLLDALTLYGLELMPEAVALLVATGFGVIAALVPRRSSFVETAADLGRSGMGDPAEPVRPLRQARRQGHGTRPRSGTTGLLPTTSAQ
ncbi:DUF6064 family protein [Jiella mangrovi]|uniref:Uncharacterized protein n=1 Tax=Jiella mangrovi TaxID=2821407 RepID=A0ABS4BDQ4_9HYPH|nr:DUF6064 family protein [Jiella mangrovi]MBP0614194.1 hypothetical protein [Jiella mangrovi]